MKIAGPQVLVREDTTTTRNLALENTQNGHVEASVVATRTTSIDVSIANIEALARSMHQMLLSERAPPDAHHDLLNANNLERTQAVRLICYLFKEYLGSDIT